jgi:hypothetical protein
MMATMTMEAMTATTMMSAMVRRMVVMDGGAGFPDEDVQVSSRARALEVGGDARVRRALDDACRRGLGLAGPAGCPPCLHDVLDVSSMG